MTDKTLQKVISSPDIRTLNSVLTKLMTEKKIHSAIEDENLRKIIDAVLSLNSESYDGLLSAAVLGRLAAVARGREDEVFSNISVLFNQEPPTLETLDDGDEKYYASVALRYSDAGWLSDYCYQEALRVDTAEKARKELFKIALDNQGSLSIFLNNICTFIDNVNSIPNIDTRAKRVRRIFLVLVEVINEWKKNCDPDIGEALDKCLNCMIRNLKEAEERTLFHIVGAVLTILQRVIALRFSLAFDAETYKVIGSCKRILGNRNWSDYISQSTVINDVRNSLLEAAVVLARQNRTDSEFIKLLADVYGSKNQVSSTVGRYFDEHRDIDAEIRDWWVKTGDIKQSRRQAEHKMGGSEDQQIGALMIEVESVKQAMEKLERAIIPFLEMHDPVLASTVKKASAGYANISRIARQLGRMRKLVTTNLKGERLEYNPQQHEMLGGHKPGVRKVKVVRDGVQKDFAGKIKTLVKCWVEPQE